MCGRTCLTLAPEELKNACKYKRSEDGQKSLPEFRNEHNLGRKYSKNINLVS